MTPLELLAYYDVLDRPLTREELGGVPHGKSIGERDGHYYLFDREYLVPLRKEHERQARKKWRIARRIAWWLRFVPFVRVVFASGSLSMNNTDELSDLDVVIIAKHGHIWTARFLVNGLLRMLRKGRRHEDRVAPDKICPNHFITDQSLHIPFHGMYTAHLYVHLVPLVVVEDEDLNAFHSANRWVLEYVPAWNISRDRVVPQGLSFAIQWLGELTLGLFGNLVERATANYQRHRIEVKTNIIRPGGHLVYNDRALAFHLGSSEADVLRKYEKNLSLLL